MIEEKIKVFTFSKVASNIASWVKIKNESIMIGINAKIV